MTHPAGQEASVEFRFRNAERVSFTAQEINVKELLADVKDYLKSNPKELQWERVAINNIGFMLVEKDQRKYVGREAARWDLDLQPREKHFDRIVRGSIGDVSLQFTM